MSVVLGSLRSLEFLAKSPPEAPARLMSIGRRREFEKGHEFWRAGDEPSEVVVPVTGEAEAVSRDDDGHELVGRLVGSGECLGLVSALDGLPHPQDARVSRTGEFFVVPRSAFLRFLEDTPAARVGALQSVGRLYRLSLRDREEGVFEHVEQRVARFLVRRACVRQGDGARILVHATHSEIAARLGSVREVVARAMAEFAARGVVERRGHVLFIADWAALHEAARLEPRKPIEPSAMRTLRFFLPLSERRRGGERAEDAVACREHLADLSPCIRRGCPAAFDPARQTSTV